MTTVNEEKISFVLYGSYEEQLDMLSNEQAGEWIKGVYHYMRTGEKQCEDPMAGLLLSVVSHQLDIDAQKYAERVERQKEAAKKAGKASAEKRALKKEMENQRLSTTVEKIQRFQHEDVYEDVYEDVDVDVDEDDDDIRSSEQQQQRQEDEEDVCAREAMPVDNSFFLFGKNQLPTTDEELEQAQALAEKLFGYYHHRQASQADVERVFEAVYRPAYTADDEAYAAFDQSRADLLEFAFRQAALQDQVKWSYIDTILDKYRKNDIETVEQAEEYEYMRNRGEVL